MSFLSPVRRPGVSNAVNVAPNDTGALVLTATGGIVGWGANSSGVLGNGTTTDSAALVAVVGLPTGAVDLWANSNSQVYALLSDGTVWSWGYTYLGDGSWKSQRSTPAQVAGLSGVRFGAPLTTAMWAAVDSTGILRVWGSNRSGALGLGNTTPQYSPVATSLPVGAPSVASLTMGGCGGSGAGAALLVLS